MTTLIEEMRAAVLELWQSLGFDGSSKTAAAVVPALVLGITLNVIALNVVGRIRAGEHASCRKAGWTHVVRAEVKLVHALVASTLKAADKGQQKICSVRQWVLERHSDAARYRSQASRSWVARMSTRGVTIRVRMVSPEFGRCRPAAKRAA